MVEASKVPIPERHPPKAGTQKRRKGKKDVIPDESQNVEEHAHEEEVNFDENPPNPEDMRSDTSDDPELENIDISLSR